MSDEKYYLDGDNSQGEDNGMSDNIDQDFFNEEVEGQELEAENDSQYRPKEEKKAKRKAFKGSLISYIALALVASLIGGFASAYMGPKVFGKILPDPKTNEYVSQPVNIATSDDINTVSAVVKKSMGSVVGITTLETQQYLFQQRDVEGLGSGVIVDRNGYILTNSHVVANGKAKEINVLFDNGEKVSGKVLWNDPILDLAIVKVDITNLPAASLGDSDELEVGEIAIAIGNPLGLEFQRTVTSGIISGLNRSIRVDQNSTIDGLIQTDASINPGNSGGPLLNKKGEVIGINTAKIQSGEGLGFSIPINTAKSIIEEVINKGSYETVELGISGLDTKEYQIRIGSDLGLGEGAIVLKVDDNSPAEKAGVMRHDIIIKIDDIEVESMQSLKKSLYRYRRGDKAMLTIIRNGKEEKIEIIF